MTTLQHIVIAISATMAELRYVGAMGV